MIRITTAAILMFAITASVSSCKKEEIEPEPEPIPMPEPEPEPEPDPAVLETATYNYSFHNGQAVPSAPYDGTHSGNLSATLKLDELASGNTTITVVLSNAVNGQTYNVHSHDAADPATTTNGTPYLEAPNTNVFVQSGVASGGTLTLTQEATMTFTALTETYDAFFVVHDPLQPMSTTDISTYVLLGSFARTQAATNYQSSSFAYAFNTGQVDPSYAYSGTHATTLTGSINVQELADNKSRISVTLMNSINGETYNVHSHDVADPATTPNGTPYNESPNGDVCAMQIDGNGASAINSQISSMSFTAITTTYEGFFVVHDPLQAITTTDPTTYVLLNSFAR